jgi:hypothetical protein
MKSTKLSTLALKVSGMVTLLAKTVWVGQSDRCATQLIRIVRQGKRHLCRLTFTCRNLVSLEHLLPPKVERDTPKALLESIFD